MCGTAKKKKKKVNAEVKEQNKFSLKKAIRKKQC